MQYQDSKLHTSPHPEILYAAMPIYLLELVQLALKSGDTLSEPTRITSHRGQDARQHTRHHTYSSPLL